MDRFADDQVAHAAADKQHVVTGVENHLPDVKQIDRNGQEHPLESTHRRSCRLSLDATDTAAAASALRLFRLR